MAQGRGSAFCLGVQKATTWGTAVTVDAANLNIRPIDWELSRSVNGLPFEGFNCDSVEKESSDVGRVMYSGSFSFDMKNEGLEKLIALTLGTAGAPAVLAGAWRHDLYRKVDHDVFGTIAWWDGYKTWEIDSAIFHSLKLSGVANGAVKGEVSWIGRALSQNTGTNPSGLTSLTENPNITRWLYDDTADYQFGVQGAGARAEFEVMAWEWSHSKEVDTDNAFSNINGKYMRQPQCGAVTESGSITIPHNTSTMLDTILTKATQEMFFLHTATTLVNEGGLYLPSVTFQDASHPPEGKASIMQTLDFTCAKADATPSGFLQPVSYISLTNQVSTNPLA